MALNGYTKCITVLLVLLGTSLCQARRLKLTTVVNGSLNEELIPADVRQASDDLIAAVLRERVKEINAEIADQGSSVAESDEDVNAPPGRRLLAEPSEVESDESNERTVVSTSGSGTTSTTSKTRVAVSPGSSGSAGATYSTSATAGTTTTTTRGRAATTRRRSQIVVPERRHVVRAGVRAAHDGEVTEEEVAPGESPAKVMESEVARTKDDTAESEEPVVADKGSLPSHFSGGQVSIDLGVSSSSGTTRISAGSTQSGRGSASGRLGGSTTTTKVPHDAVVPVPATVEIGDEH